MFKVEEKMFFFNGSRKRSLFGFLHLPLASPKHTCIIYCHPFAEEKNMSHSVVVKTSRELAKLGYPVLRFDLSGCGDSEGELDEVTIDDWQEDLSNAVNYIKTEEKITNYALWGLRSGCGIALLHAANNSDVSFLLLWQPVVDFKTYITQFFRWKISTQISYGRNNGTTVSMMVKQIYDKGVVSVIGYPISKMFYKSFCKVDKQPFHFTALCPTLLLSISLMDQPSFVLEHYFNSLKSRGVQVQFRHLTSEPFWDRYWRYECDKVTKSTIKLIDDLF